jgi:trimeric autotransporter adhesin
MARCSNSAFGYQAIGRNGFATSGNYNAAMGSSALYANASGAGNAALGHAALYFSTTGSHNLANGYAAGYNGTMGSYNVAVGYAAGYNQTTGSNNIYVGNRGVAAESGVIRIGTSSTQTETYIAGIGNAQITGSAVYVTSSGQLGVLASSER